MSNLNIQLLATPVDRTFQISMISKFFSHACSDAVQFSTGLLRALVPFQCSVQATNNLVSDSDVLGKKIVCLQRNSPHPMTHARYTYLARDDDVFISLTSIRFYIS